jgi:hypothetical protein
MSENYRIFALYARTYNCFWAVRFRNSLIQGEEIKIDSTLSGGLRHRLISYHLCGMFLNYAILFSISDDGQQAV